MALSHARKFKLFVTPGTLRFNRWANASWGPVFDPFKSRVSGLWKDNWSSYTAGNWELNAAPTWAGISGVGGSPPCTIVPGSGLVQVAQAGGVFNGVNRPQLAVQGKTRKLDCKVAFQAAGSGAGGVQFHVGIDSTGTVSTTGNCFAVQGNTNGTWSCLLLIDGSQQSVVNGITVNLNTQYDVAIEVDALGHVNGYLNGVLMSSYTFGGSTAGTKAGLRVDGGGNASGNGLQIMTVTMNGSAH